MPSLEKMRAIRKQQRARAGKVTPLEPKAKKGRSKSKRTGIRDTAKKTQEATAKKKAADAKTPKAKTPKVKTTVKETAVKKTPTKVVGAGAGAGRLIGVASRLAGWVGAAYGALHFVDPAMKHLFPKSKPGTRTPKQKAYQDRASEIMRSYKDPWSDIMGGGSKNPNLGRQPDPPKKVKEAVYLSTMPNPVPRPPAEKKLGQQPEAGKSLSMLAEKKVVKTRGVTKPKSKPALVPTSVPTSVSAPAPTLVKKVVSEPTQHRITYPKAAEVKVVAAEKQVAERKDVSRLREDSKGVSAYPKGMSRGQVRITEKKSPKGAERVTKDFDTTMGVYGWNNLTNSFGYLGTEKEVGKLGGSTYFTEGYRRGSKIKKKKA